MTKDDPHSPEAVVERIVRRAVPDHFRDCAKWRSQLRIALLDGGLCFRPGDRPREGLVVMSEEPTAKIGQAIYAAWDAFGEDAIMGPEEAIAIYRATVAAMIEAQETAE